LRTRLLRSQTNQREGTSTGSNNDDNPFFFTIEDKTNDNNDEDSSSPFIARHHQELVEMSTELKQHASVRSLKEDIRIAAVRKIVRAYGEGAVKVVIDFDLLMTRE